MKKKEQNKIENASDMIKYDEHGLFVRGMSEGISKTNFTSSLVSACLTASAFPSSKSAGLFLGKSIPVGSFFSAVDFGLNILETMVKVI